jgi:hypothetical protein
MLGAELGLPVAHLDNHASYIDHWLKLLRDDDRAISTAAAKAEEASSLLLKLGGRELADDDASALPRWRPEEGCWADRSVTLRGALSPSPCSRSRTRTTGTSSTNGSG